MTNKKSIAFILLVTALPLAARADEDRSDNLRKAVQTGGLTMVGVGAADFAIHQPISNKIQKEVDKQYNAAMGEAFRLEAEKHTLMKKLTPEIQKTYAAAEAEVN